MNTSGRLPERTGCILSPHRGFSDIGQRLAQGPGPAGERYEKWIEMYSSDEFADLAVWCRDLVDRVAAGLPEDTLRRMEDAFLTSSRYELLFWEMAWQQERWPA